jgi:hypothetical protein
MNPRRFLFAALAPVTLLAAPAANGQGPLAGLLPEDTLVYVSMPDIDTSIKEFGNTPLAKIWAEPQVRDFFAGVIKMAEEQIQEGLGEARKAYESGEFPFDPDELLKLRIRGLSFAVTKMNLHMPEGASEPLPDFGLVMHADFGESAPIWQKVIKTGMGMLVAEAGDDVQYSEQTLGNTQAMFLRPKGEMDMPMGLNMAFAGNGLVVTSLRPDFDRVLGKLTAAGSTTDATPSLLTSERFQSSSQRLTYAGSEMELYVSVAGMMDFVSDVLHLARDHAPDFPPMLDVDGIDRAMLALGLRSFESFGATWHYQSKGAVSESFVAMPLDSRKGLTAGMTPRLDQSFLKWVPKDAVSFSASRFDIAKIYPALVGALRAYNEDMAEQMLGRLAQMEEQLGVSLEKDVFGAFGDEFYSWSMPMSGMTGLPEMAFIFKVSNKEGLLRSLEKIAALSQGYVVMEKSQRKGVDYWRMEIHIDELEQMGSMNPLAMLTPTFSFTGEYLVAGLSTSDVRRASARMEREDDPSGDIRSNPEFEPYAGQIPADINSLSFTDWKIQFDGIYQALSGVLAFIPMGEEIPIDPSLLPDSSVITKHLFGALSWSRDSKEGMFAHSMSPFGPEVFAALAIGVGAGLSVASVARF